MGDGITQHSMGSMLHGPFRPAAHHCIHEDRFPVHTRCAAQYVQAPADHGAMLNFLPVPSVDALKCDRASKQLERAMPSTKGLDNHEMTMRSSSKLKAMYCLAKR